jgi:hypothetical protein
MLLSLLAVAPVAINWLQPAGPADGLPPVEPAPPALAQQAAKLADNEGATFARRLSARSYQLWPAGAPAALPVVLKRGGNRAKLGYVLGGKPLPAAPYLELDATEKAMGVLFAHEAGHYLHFRVLGGRPADPIEALPHTLFAVTSRETALAEGYGIHFEAVAAHFGQAQRGFYHRLAPRFGGGWSPAGDAPFYFPLGDLTTYSQTWSRYQAVRDGLAAFHAPGGYMHDQLDPGRDRGALRSPGQLAASEGVAASWMFWRVVSRALDFKIPQGAGLAHAGLMTAEEELLQGLADACKRAGPHAGIHDLVEAHAARFPAQAATDRAIWLDLTHGGTADPALAGAWHDLAEAALVMDTEALGKQIPAFEQRRTALLGDPAKLWAALGPQVPVKAAGATVRIFGEEGEVQFDLNALGPAELALVPGLAPADRDHILGELGRQPFASFADFARRVGPAAARPFGTL